MQAANLSRVVNAFGRAEPAQLAHLVVEVSYFPLELQIVAVIDFIFVIWHFSFRTRWSYQTHRIATYTL